MAATNAPSADNSDSAVSKTRVRQQIIFRRVVLDNQPLSLEELRELCKDPSFSGRRADRVRWRKRVGKDVSDFANVGCYLKIRRRNGSKEEEELVFLEGPHTDDDTVREELNQPAKALVAEMVARLITGFPECEPKFAHLLPGWMDRLHTVAHSRALEHLWRSSDERDTDTGKIVAALSHLGEKAGLSGPLSHVKADVKAVKALLESNNQQLEGRANKLKRVLANFWGEANRMIAIDSGTTNIVLARKFLAEMRIPMAGSPLCALTVCTNSRRIFEVLGQSTVPVKTIIIGGQQKFRSPTICGAMAELFLKAVSLLQFGMCILGATRLDLDHFAVCSDSQEESSIKTLLMERSSLRVIAVDHNKLQAGLGRTGYKFASIDPEHIDLIVTNSPLKTDPPAAFTAFLRFVKAIESRGVPVLVATSEQTQAYPPPDVA